MIDKIIKEINIIYNLEFNYKVKIPFVYTIYFKIEKTEISFIYMFDKLSNYENNLNELKRKVNSEIINYYLRKEKNEKNKDN